jgi:hypothetical protein
VARHGASHTWRLRPVAQNWLAQRCRLPMSAALSGHWADQVRMDASDPKRTLIGAEYRILADDLLTRAKKAGAVTASRLFSQPTERECSPVAEHKKVLIELTRKVPIRCPRYRQGRYSPAGYKSNPSPIARLPTPRTPVHFLRAGCMPPTAARNFPPVRVSAHHGE